MKNIVAVWGICFSLFAMLGVCQRVDGKKRFHDRVVYAAAVLSLVAYFVVMIVNISEYVEGFGTSGAEIFIGVISIIPVAAVWYSSMVYAARIGNVLLPPQ